MWRGVQTMLSGCVPAHAAYFTIYEGCKAAFSQPLPRVPADAGSAADGADSVGRGDAEPGGAGVTGAAPDGACSPLAAGAAVALATMAHDVIMTPMDCIKQRLQLGYHSNSLVDCACDMLRHEGPRAFLVSYPTTLLMNVPYALIMGSTNEALRNVLNPGGEHSLPAYLLSGAGAGMVAAAATNPLDVVKTRLQTQHLCLADATGAPTPPGSTAAQGRPCPRAPLAYQGMVHAARTLWRDEGPRCFLRGVQARMLIHAPSVAICWTTYESIKRMLTRMRAFD